ncbi:murein transglycosylase [Actinoplanes sp. NPDC049265]|uniref:lytic transglycosylase domain-containing protein n=1 Tax=Actinoplanes sp. NPDC049265 TaxID=3363902 RepID=UPI003717C632
MAERHEDPSKRPGNDDASATGARPPAPHQGGPLGSSGAAPGTPGSGPSTPPEPTVPASPSPAPEVRPSTTPSGNPSPAASNRKRRKRKAAPAAEAPTAKADSEAPAKDSESREAPGNNSDTEEGAGKEGAGKEGDSEAAAGEGGDSKEAAGRESDSKDGAAGDSKASENKAVEDEKKGEDGVEIDLDKPVVVTTASSSGARVTRVLRRANPIKAARTATRSTSDWARRPSGRLLIPAIAAALLIGAAGAAGAYLVPRALEAGAAPSRSPGFPLDQAAGGPGAPTGGAAFPQNQPSGGGFSIDPVLPPVVGNGRPADSLQGWAQGVGTRVGIPVVAVQAYGYAELVVAKLLPTCHLSWTTIAAIAKVESSHGSANGSVLNADGTVQPPIYGLPLDGKGGRQLIADTDKGVLDGDSTYDRAIGPLQFIPATWQQMATRKQVDADNSGAADPNDIDDASMAAAIYLCQSGRDLSKADAWWDAILSYNAVRPYAQKVFDAANEYGQRSRV